MHGWTEAHWRELARRFCVWLYFIAEKRILGLRKIRRRGITVLRDKHSQTETPMFTMDNTEGFTPAKINQLSEIDISEIHENLLEDIGGSTTGWSLHKGEYQDKTVSNQHYQIVFNHESNRAGIIFCGSGSSGHTEWTDATSAENAFARFLNGTMAN
jgi:hypothetical protein